MGCSPAREQVFVDIDLVPLSSLKTEKTPVPVLDFKGLSSESKSIPGQSAIEVENLRGDQKKKLQEEVERETQTAIATITTRLQDYYQRDIDEFFKAESAKLGPMKDSLNIEYLNKMRSIFEESAKKRGPLLTRFVFLTEFPPPLSKSIPPDSPDISAPAKRRTDETRDLQRQINAIDTEYEKALVELDESHQNKLAGEADAINGRLKDKQKEINNRAQAEASQLVRRFSSGLTGRIFSKYTFQLPATPTKTANFPTIQAQSEVPRVPFDRTLAGKETKELVERELDAFLELNRYERTPIKTGVRDVTQEFIEWRKNLKSGHWESWQKSSKLN